MIVVKARLDGQWVLLEKEGKLLYEQSGYGRPIGTGLRLSPAEALYLVHRGKIEVPDHTFDTLLTLFSQDSGFIRQFLVYWDIRERGYAIQTGPQDFRVFRRGHRPGRGESLYMVRVISERDLIDFSKIHSDLCATAHMRKQHVIGVVDDENEITYYEIKRQKELLEKGETPKQETRGFDIKSGKTYIQRTKEEAHDYRYFPEPDIPPFTNLKAKSQALRANLPELPDQKIARFVKDYKISQYSAEILCSSLKTADYYEETIKVKSISSLQSTISNQHIANLIVNKKIDIGKYLPAELIQMLVKKSTGQTIDEKELEKIIKEVIKKNQKAISDYKKGKQTAITFLIGQVMKETKGKAKPDLAKKNIMSLLSF